MAMKLRRAAVAGQFYPDNPAVLAREVSTCLDAAAPRIGTLNDMGVGVAPHAGYFYSGTTAGHTYTALRHHHPQRVVLLGCSHRYRFHGAALGDFDAFETPLGTVPVDGAFRRLLAKQVDDAGNAPHLQEHSLEVQLPFVQTVFKGTPIVPVLFGAHADETHRRFGEMLARILGPEDVVIASTDLSHFLTEDEAQKADRNTLDAVLSMDPARLSDDGGEYSLCGGAAVAAAMACAVARGADHAVLLEHSTSARASGDTGRVVGYAAVVFAGKLNEPSHSMSV